MRHTYGTARLGPPRRRDQAREPPLAAARREMGEELGLGGAAWTDVGELPATSSYRHDMIHCFRAELREPSLTATR